MEFAIGCDPGAFRRYYEAIERAAEKTGTLDGTEGRIVAEDPSHLIIWREGDEIIGHAIWHESSTSEHRAGDPREEEDREILEKLLGGEKELVELHEIWLMEEYRGKGHGKRFFEFFEEFIRDKGHHSIAFYADHPAALAICRKRGYTEEYSSTEGWFVFALRLGE